MKANKRSLINSFWFVTEVIGVFILVQLIHYVFGHWDAWLIGLALLVVAFVLFLVAFLIARSKDRQNRNNTSTKAFSGSAN